MKHELTAMRLRKALGDNGLRAQDLAELSGVSKASISQYVNGTNRPSNLSAGKMASVLCVNPLWLMGFEVSEEPEKFTPTDDELEVIRALRIADPVTRGIVFKILNLPR
jgi:transcriptional regulator with XRE-family HTH domain